MPKAKQRNATLSGLVDSDSDDHFAGNDAMPTPDSATENAAVAKKGRGRGKTTKVAPMKVIKAKAPSRRSSGRPNTKSKPFTAAQKKTGKRPALADKTNQQHVSDTEEVDEFAQDEEAVVVQTEIEDTVMKVVEAKQPKLKATTKKAPVKRGGKAAKEDSVEDTKPKSRPGRKKAPAKEQIPEESSEKIMLETQVQEMDVDVEADDEVEETVSITVNNAARSRSDDRARQPPVKRRRAGSSSDTERDNPSLRRKLGDMTKKYDALHIRFQDLKEVASKEADHTFDRYKKQSEEKEKGRFPLEDLHLISLTNISLQQPHFFPKSRCRSTNRHSKRKQNSQEKGRSTINRYSGSQYTNNSVKRIALRGQERK